MDEIINERCEHRDTVPGKPQSRCSRRKRVGPFCLQHDRAARERVEAARKILANLYATLTPPSSSRSTT
jgi:hypothetical protein